MWSSVADNCAEGEYISGEAIPDLISGLEQV